ncbi:YggS family pyridoxal phosphate enzyme, partial [candidate division WOR-3 bacterium]|nr:YggS family pyridoxal phosphate enzyme [candidate division WOR-3 bacterium]MBD3363881.1 YggS family pyridoxal phosphate enzyme [candidate division WOR-3 bacterium]
HTLKKEHIKLIGLMTLGPLTGDQVAIRKAFSSLREHRNRVENVFGHYLPHLSMGMSEDFEIAVEEGATLVRLGRVLFGPRRT